MYRIIGADGREYGPIAAAQLRQWIAEGRANALTKARPEGATEWKPLCEIPEFAAIFAAPGATNATPASPAGAVAISTGDPVADAIGREILERDYQLDIGSCVSRAWELVKGQFWLTVGAAAIVYLLVGGLGSVPILGAIAVLLLTYVLEGGLKWMLLRLIRGEKAELGDAFAGFNQAFKPLMLFSLVAQLLTGVGFLFCILPGIYLSVCWFGFGPLLVMDKKLDFWPAMELSRKVVSKHWWSFLGLALVNFLILLAGVLACGVGVFIALPVVAATTVYAYVDIFGSVAPLAPASQAPAPPATPPTP
jgi:hypothetical protein